MARLLLLCLAISVAAGPRVEPNWIWRGDGGQKDAYFGVAISANGDFNGDGFADLASGASYYDDGEADEGAVFIYHGTASGLASGPTRTLTVNQAGTYFGASTSVGNVNNDAYDDLIVGSIGAVYIYHGSSIGLPATPARTLTGDANFGIAISATGDVNGDNYDDLVIGASLHDAPLTDEGAVFLHLGSASGIANSASWSLTGGQALMYFGSVLAIVGDTNGDNRDDLLVGAPGYDGNALTDEGAAFLYFGTTTGFANSADWWLTGGNENMGFGGTVGGAGDTNADTYADILIGAPYHDNGNADEGAAFLYFGSVTGPDTADWADEGAADEAFFGIALSGVGDVNDDGYDDIVIGASGVSLGEQDEGVAVLYLGSATGPSTIPLWYGQLNTPQGTLGAAISAGDFSNDGVPDIVIGALYADNTLRDEGSVLIFAGKPSAPQAATAGFGSGVAGSYFGVSVANAGDVNGDTFDDVIVGASLYSNGNTSEGAAFLYLGSALGLSITPAWSFEGEQDSAFVGATVVGAGDVNGDTFDDVMVGASGYDGAFTDSGRAMLFLGTATGLTATPIRSIDGPHASAFLGNAIAAGDVTGDGKSDVLIGLSTHDNAVGTDAGSASLYIGTASGLSPQPAWTANGPQLGSFFGGTVGIAGDVNNDGRQDVLIGAAIYSDATNYTARATLYRGSISGLTGPVWTKNQSQQNTYYVFRSLGDTNGDSFDDFALGSPNYDSGGLADRGIVELYRGSNGTISASPAWSALGDSANFLFGGSLASGDLNADGHPDLLVGVLGYDNPQTDEGQVVAYYGNGSTLESNSIWEVEPNQLSTGFGVALATANIDGDAYPETIIGSYLYDGMGTDEGRLFIYQGLAGTPELALPQRFNSAQQYAYSSLATASADFNGDGYPDLAIAAPYEDQGSSDEGLVRIFLGSVSGFLEAASSTIQLDQASSYLGLALAAGDVDNDGFADLAVGVPYYELGNETDEGLVALYKGSAGGLASVPSWTQDGGQAEAYFGISLALLDVNGDQRDDLAVGSSLYDATGTDNGRVQLYLASGSGFGTTASWTQDGDQDTAYFGAKVASAGDINGDNYDDLLVGASFYDGVLPDEGRAYLFHGSASGLANSAAWTQDGGQAEAYFGVTLAGVGDINGDTYDDVLAGATFYDGGETDEGRATLYFGSATGLATTAAWTIGADQENAYLGAALGPAGDTNGDGFDDFLIGATYYDSSALNDGLAILFLGSASGPTSTANWSAGGGANSAFFGAAFTAADYDRDGFSDFLVSATGFALDKIDSGGAFLYYGASDMDGDGMVDSWELAYGLDPRDPSDGDGDLDNDRLSNIAEHHAGSSPTVVDTDSDGVSDYLEVIHGSNPTDSADSANLFYVAKWGDDGSGTGSSIAPWASITHALAAVAASVANPIAFYVAKGSYCETLGFGHHESLLGAYTETFAARTALTAITGDIVLPDGAGVDGFAITGSIMMGGSALAACTISGGGIINSGNSTIAGCLIVGNTTGISNAGGAAKLIHNTFAANSADISGSGHILKNCVFDNPDPGFAYSESGTWTTASSTGSCTTTVTDATATWTENEFFGLLLDHRLILANSATTLTIAGEYSIAAGASYEIVNYRLGSQSSAIDAAIVDADTPVADRDGNIGYDDLGMANIGSGALTYIDMGAFERQHDSAVVPPSVRPDSVTAQEDIALIGNVTANDLGASPLSIVGLSNPAAGSLTLAASGAFTYTPVPEDSGSYSFSYRATDTAANSASTTVSIVVAAVNDAPVAVVDSITVIENGSTSGNVLGNDTDIDSPTLSAILSANSAHGSLMLASDGSFTYTPTPEYFGDDSFTYQANDGFANSAPATVSITIFNVAAIGPPVGSFQVRISPGQTVGVGDPYGGDLASTLAATASAGDQLHIWVDDHFNTYEHSSSDWRILGSTTSPDPSRFSSARGYLLTRTASGTATFTISGSIPTAATASIPIPAASTVIFAYPYPQGIHPARLPWTGATDRDELRIWNAATATWTLHTRSAGTWSALADSATVRVGTPMLYRHAGSDTTLTFQRLY